MRFGVQLAAGLLALSVSFIGSAGLAADLDRAMTPPSGAVAPDEDQLHAYVARRAVLYEIRSMFDVVRADDVEYLLLADALNVEGTSLSAAQAELDRDLLSEGNYFLVSLKYTIDGGGAAWPSDRPAANYINDAMVHIAAMQSELSDVLAQSGDPLPIMVEANSILAQTEGVAELTDDINFFSKRDQIVAAVLKQVKEHA